MGKSKRLEKLKRKIEKAPPEVREAFSNLRAEQQQQLADFNKNLEDGDSNTVRMAVKAGIRQAIRAGNVDPDIRFDAVLQALFLLQALYLRDVLDGIFTSQVPPDEMHAALANVYNKNSAMGEQSSRRFALMMREITKKA
jgi:hypothetical protein